MCVCWPEPPDLFEWVWPKAFSTDSVQYSLVRKEEEGVLMCFRPTLVHRCRAAEGHWSPTAPYSVSVIAWGHYGTLKWWREALTARWTHRTFSRGHQSLPWTAVFLATGTFKLISYEIKVRKRGKWSQYHVLIFFLNASKTDAWEVFQVIIRILPLSFRHRDASTHMYIHIH